MMYINSTSVNILEDDFILGLIDYRHDNFNSFVIKRKSIAKDKISSFINGSILNIIIRSDMRLDTNTYFSLCY